MTTGIGAAGKIHRPLHQAYHDARLVAVNGQALVFEYHGRSIELPTFEGLDHVEQILGQIGIVQWAPESQCWRFNGYADQSLRRVPQPIKTLGEMSMKQQLIPTDSDTCLALVKPRSGLARECRLGKPTYGVYEYDKTFGTYVIRWGDGSWQELTIEQHGDLVLMPEYGKDFLESLFDR